jgi:hypothetical protein
MRDPHGGGRGREKKLWVGLHCSFLRFMVLRRSGWLARSALRTFAAARARLRGHNACGWSPRVGEDRCRQGVVSRVERQDQRRHRVPSLVRRELEADAAGAVVPDLIERGRSDAAARQIDAVFEQARQRPARHEIGAVREAVDLHVPRSVLGDPAPEDRRVRVIDADLHDPAVLDLPRG